MFVTIFVTFLKKSLSLNLNLNIFSLLQTWSGFMYIIKNIGEYLLPNIYKPKLSYKNGVQ